MSDDLRERLKAELTVPLWPDAAKALGIGRQHAYERANSGEICVIKIGRVLRVPTAWLRRVLQMEDR
jgi:hypothetical protein